MSVLSIMSKRGLWAGLTVKNCQKGAEGINDITDIVDTSRDTSRDTSS